MEKLEEYSDITTRLVSETVACTPEEWSHGTLTIDCDGTRINYKLKNEEQPGTAVISEKLRDLIDELYVRMSRHGDTWTRATIDFEIENGDAKFSNSFRYAVVESPPPLSQVNCADSVVAAHSVPQVYSVGEMVAAQGPPPQVYGLGGMVPDQDVHNQTLQRTGAAKKRSWFQRLFRRGPGR